MEGREIYKYLYTCFLCQLYSGQHITVSGYNNDNITIMLIGVMYYLCCNSYIGFLFLVCMNFISAIITFIVLLRYFPNMSLKRKFSLFA